MGWISWYCALQGADANTGHEYLVPLPHEYLQDDFNMQGLAAMFPDYRRCLALILDLEDDEPDRNVEAWAEGLYLLAHQRFLCTKQGVAFMAQRYQDGDFGACPRYHCGGCPVVPTGSNSLGTDCFKLYCPRCLDVYQPPQVPYLTQKRFRTVDGAAFGRSFAPLLFLTFPMLVPPLKSQGLVMQRLPLDSSDEDSDESDNERTIGDYCLYLPRIYGFRVSSANVVAQTMHWLRTKSE